MDKQTVGHPHSGILLRSEKEWTSETPQHHEWLSNALSWVKEARPLHTICLHLYDILGNRFVSGARDEGRLDYHMAWVTFLGDGIILYLDYSGGYRIGYIYQSS